jgi:cytochrome c
MTKLAVAIPCFVLLVSTGCRTSIRRQQAEVHTTASNLMIQYGCPTCHVIPGVPGAVGNVGPSLRSVAHRSYLAGTLPNTPTNMEHWIMHPQSIHPGTAMPDMGVTPSDAQRISDFLESGH